LICITTEHRGNDPDHRALLGHAQLSLAL